VFSKFATTVSTLMGRPWVFATAFVLLLAWGASGPMLGFSDTWQLVVNTTTTIITFLMVFIIQNTQNRDNLAINIKLDALLKDAGITEEKLLAAEDKSDQELEEQREEERDC
jgi:low affinity Fe/Cu permease